MTKVTGFQLNEMYEQIIVNPRAVSKLKLTLDLKEIEFAPLHIPGTDFQIYSIYSNEVIRISLGTKDVYTRKKAGEIILRSDSSEVYRLPNDEVEYPVHEINGLIIDQVYSLKPSLKFEKLGAFFAKDDIRNYIESILKEAKIASIMLP